jgi:predicted nucleic acid-binding Zn ribbon protein
MAENNLDWVANFYQRMAGTTLGRVGRDEKRRDLAMEKDSQPFDKGRDPVTARDSIGELISEFRWKPRLDESELFSNWELLVGKETAASSTPATLDLGVLVVKCKSTAWATQLNIISQRYLETINLEYPDLNIREIRFVGPVAPSWKKGPKSVPGRGPRDTYG